jgi:hypothetical protein
MSIKENLVPAVGENVAIWPVHDPSSRENCLREDLTRRLTTVCAGLSSPDFEALVQRMTREQMRGERVMTRVFNHS